MLPHVSALTVGKYEGGRYKEGGGGRHRKEGIVGTKQSTPVTGHAGPEGLGI